jgi:hypothetical protein
MVAPPTFDQLTHSLEACGLPYGVLALENEVRLVLTERGGRLMGPFLPDGTSVAWINPMLADAGSFGRFLESSDWNMGGDRIWIAPEVQYLATDRDRFNETCVIPEQMDPGSWTLARADPGADRWVLRQRATLEAYSLARGRKTLDVVRQVSPAPNPLRNLRGAGSLLAGVRYAGWEQTVTLAETVSDDIVSETWNVLQVRPGSTILIPCSPRIEISEIGGYRHPVPEAARAVRGNHLQIEVTGDRQWKIGLRSAHVTGRLGCLVRPGSGEPCLLVRNFGNNPSALYAEESFDQPGNNGNSVHVYHDDGELGSFGELECNGQAIGGPTGRSASTDTFTTWVYLGPTAAIGEIAAHLLGIEPFA